MILLGYVVGVYLVCAGVIGAHGCGYGPARGVGTVDGGMY